MIELTVIKTSENPSVFTLSPSSIEIGGKDSSLIDSIHVNIPPEWQGKVIRATFNQSALYGGNIIPKILNAEGVIELKNDVTLCSGDLVIDAVGVDGSVSPSTGCHYTVYSHPKFGGTEQVVTPSEYQQFVAETKGYSDSAQANATAANASKEAAALSEQNAKNSETAAQTAQEAAENAKAAAQGSAEAAAQSETNSKNSETAAKTSETNSKTSETNSANSALAAAGSATAAEASKNSAAQSAEAAQANATAANASKEAAALSEQNAKNSETAAQTAQEAAETNATAAQGSAGAAAQSETNSKSSEEHSAQSETNSKASEAAAKTSETNSANSAAAAAGSATAAEASKNQAESAANAAQAANIVNPQSWTDAQKLTARTNIDLSDGEWITPTLIYGFTQYADSPLKYRLTHGGKRLEFKGRIVGTQPNPAFSVVTSYLPGEKKFFMVINDAGGACSAQFTSNDNYLWVGFQGALGNYISFDNVNIPLD